MNHVHCGGMKRTVRLCKLSGLSRSGAEDRSSAPFAAVFLGSADMDYRRFGNTIIARIDRGEEILDRLAAIADAENIKLASVSAIGATDSFTVGVYDTEKKVYRSNDFNGAFEIVSLAGTVNTMDGRYYSHLHLSAGDEKGEVFGGHLNRARVSATCEAVITVIDGTVDRFRDEETGLNLFDFK